MCGIAGQVTADGGPVDRAVLGRMCAALRHRGPDSRGMHVADGVGLGIQRLRVIDLETGDQPIFNEDRHGRRSCSTARSTTTASCARASSAPATASRPQATRR